MPPRKMDKPVFSVREYGATGVAVAGETLHCPARTHSGWRPGADMEAVVWRAADGADSGSDTDGIQAAIDAAAEGGGGCVVVEAGDYLIRGLELRSGVELHLREGAALYASADINDHMRESEGGLLRQSDFDQAYQEAGGTSHHSGMVTGDAIDRAVIRAEGATDVAITGPGKLSAQGGAYFIPWWASDCREKLLRPMKFLGLRECRRVRVEDIEIRDSSGWTLHLQDCHEARVRGVRIRCLHGPNVDGIDIVDSSRVSVRDCDIFTTDDGICLKSTRPESEMSGIEVSDCKIRTLCNGFKIGTETLGHVRDVKVRGLTLYNLETDLRDGESGINLDACDGGVVESVSIESVRMERLRTAFHLYVGKRSVYQGQYRTPRAGVLRDIRLSGVEAGGMRHPSFVMGLPESPVARVVCDNCSVSTAGGHRDPPPEPRPVQPEGYPGIKLHLPAPAAALWCRHVESMELNNCRFDLAEADSRPRMRFDEASVTGDG